MLLSATLYTAISMLKEKSVSELIGADKNNVPPFKNRNGVCTAVSDVAISGGDALLVHAAGWSIHAIETHALPVLR